METDTILYCNEGNSDKEYRVSIQESRGTYGVHCWNRRVGNPWVDQGMKIQGVELWEAQAEAGKVIKSKIKKGYAIIEQTVNPQ
jgi:hypothetical protein